MNSFSDAYTRDFGTISNPWNSQMDRKQENERQRIDPQKDAKFISTQKDAIVLFDCFFKTSKSTIKGDITNGTLDFEITLENDYITAGEIKMPAVSDLVHKCEVVLWDIKNDLNIIFVFSLVDSVNVQLTFKDIQARLEGQIPQSLQGEFFKNDLKLSRDLLLPSIYVYDTRKFQWFFNQESSMDYDPMFTIPNLYHTQPTIREEVFQFVDMFCEDLINNTNNALFKIDPNFSKRISAIGKTILIFLTDSIHSNEDLTFTSNLLMFSFEEFLIKNELIFNLLCDLSQCFHLMIILAHGLDKLYLGDQPSLSKIKSQ